MKYKLRGNYSKEPEEGLYEILQNRGVKDIESFLYPTSKCELNPHDLENIEAAALLLLKHLCNNSHICFVIDCDCDGYASCSILWLYIKDIKPDADLTFVIHEHKQHGLEDQINWLTSEKRFDLVILPDAGSFDIQEHQRLHAIGTDVIVLDHHMVPQDDNGNNILPNLEWATVVNNQLSPNYNNKALCGAGVTYKFCEVLDDELGIELAHNFIDLAALGEIADVMDKTDTEVNYIMMEGLKNIKNVGFQTLIEAQAYSLKEKAVYPYPGLTTIDVAFYIAPLINAVIRVGALEEKKTLFYCFIEPDKQLPSTKRGATPGDTEKAAEQAARIAKNAKARQDRIKEKALEIINERITENKLDENNIIIVEINDDDKIPNEMTGLIAQNIVSLYSKPCFIVRRDKNDILRGSLRNNGNFKELPELKPVLEETHMFEMIAGRIGP